MEKTDIKQWAGYKNYDHYYWVNPDLVKWYSEAVKSGFPITGTRNKYYDVPASFDIETSSFVHFGEKYATMYLSILSMYDQVGLTH